MTTTTTTYNGWKNYETWCVNLHITNDMYCEEQLGEIIKEDIPDTRPASITDITARDWSMFNRADKLNDMVHEWMFDYMDDKGGMFTDLLRSAMDEVDWLEIIKNHADDYEGDE